MHPHAEARTDSSSRPAIADASPARGGLGTLIHGNAVLLLIALSLALWLPGFFALPAGDRDESRFAQATKQMNETGDYVHIMNGTIPRNRKPIGIYWLQAPAAELVDRLAAGHLANPIWPYRLPSLLGGLAAVLATFQAGLRLTRNRQAAMLAAAMLAGCVILTTETHIAKTDAALLGATTIAMAVLAYAWLGLRVHRWQAAAFWLALGAGILLKGPITPMVAGLATLTLCLWERRTAWLAALRPAWGVPLLLVLVLPWFVAIGLATHGAFFAQAVGGDLAAKLAGGAESHGGPPGLHLLLLPLLAFPATPLVLAGLAAAWSTRADPATRFLLAWLVPAWLVFEAVPTKLPHYTLPLYPALFLLAARAWPPASLPAAPPSWVRPAGRAAVAAAAIVIAGAAVALPIWLGDFRWPHPTLAAAAGAATALCTIAAATYAWRGQPARALLACIPLHLCLMQFELPSLDALWIAPRVEALLRQSWPGGAPSQTPATSGLAVAGYAEPSLVFLAGTRTQLLPNGQAAATALQSGTATAALVTDREMAHFDSKAAALGLVVHTIGQVRGFNYARGRWVTLTLLRR